MKLKIKNNKMGLFSKIDKNKVLYSGLIITFIILYGATAFVSWYHSITFFNISNDTWLSVLLSFVAEVGQASVLFSILLTANKNKFLPWAIMIILTTLQVIGNVVSTYKFIVTSNTQDFTYFQNSILFWVETGSSELFKVIIAWISGALLPIIALSMTALVAQNMKLKDEEKNNININDKTDQNIDSKTMNYESLGSTLTEEELSRINDILTKREPITIDKLVDKIKSEEKFDEEDCEIESEVNDLVDSVNTYTKKEIKDDQISVNVDQPIVSDDETTEEVDEDIHEEENTISEDDEYDLFDDIFEENDEIKENTIPDIPDDILDYITIDEMSNISNEPDNEIKEEVINDIKNDVNEEKTPPIEETPKVDIVDPNVEQQNIKKKYPKISKNR